MLKKFPAIIVMCIACTLLFFSAETGADELDCSVSVSDGTDPANLVDDNYRTKNTYAAGTVITLSSDTEIAGIYIKWDDSPGEWTLTVNGEEYTYGENGYLHEYAELPEAATSLTVTLGENGAVITDIYIFSEGELPDWVQVWEDSYESADILVFSSHSDDEILFMGSIITTYVDAGYRVQVAYFCDFYQTEPYRRHELLDGLWTMGVDHYPQLGKFADVYSTDLATAESQYDLDEALEYVVETIRRFKPQVLVSQDLNGEYGHGTHMLVAKLITQAVELTADETSYPESAAEYGTWDVPKTYLHLYTENQIELDARVPLASFGGKTALEICTEAYECHKSQQWMWFYVSDGYDDAGNATDYAYSFTKFGLYRSLVGSDTGNDIMENITSYAEQESIAQAEQESIQESIEAAEQESARIAGLEQAAAERARLRMRLITISAIVVACLVVIIAIVLIFRRVKGDKRRKRRKRKRRR